MTYHQNADRSLDVVIVGDTTALRLEAHALAKLSAGGRQAGRAPRSSRFGIVRHFRRDAPPGLVSPPRIREARANAWDGPAAVFHWLLGVTFTTSPGAGADVAMGTYRE